MSIMLFNIVIAVTVTACRYVTVLRVVWSTFAFTEW